MDSGRSHVGIQVDACGRPTGFRWDYKNRMIEGLQAVSNAMNFGFLWASFWIPMVCLSDSTLEFFWVPVGFNMDSFLDSCTMPRGIQ